MSLSLVFSFQRGKLIAWGKDPFKGQVHTETFMKEAFGAHKGSRERKVRKNV